MFQRGALEMIVGRRAQSEFQSTAICDAIAYNDIEFEVPRDHVEARRWLRPAAEQGHPEAQWRLWMTYARGLGVDVELVDVAFETLPEFVLAGDADAAQNRPRHLAEEGLDQVQPRRVLRREHELEAVGHRAGIGARLLRDVRRVVVEDQVQLRAGGRGGRGRGDSGRRGRAGTPRIRGCGAARRRRGGRGR